MSDPIVTIEPDILSIPNLESFRTKAIIAHLPIEDWLALGFRSKVLNRQSNRVYTLSH